MTKKNFAWPVTTLCKFDYIALKKCVELNRALLEQKKIVIMGAGIRGTSFSILLMKFGFKDILFTDNNENKVGGMINQFPIVPYAEVVKMKEDVVVIISVENGYNLKTQLEKSGFVENQNYFYVDNHLYDLYVSEFKRDIHMDTLILGDCGITDVSPKDTDFTNLGEMVKEKHGEERTKVLAMHGMGMRAFYHILHAQVEYCGKPDRLALMTNFETFTGKQHVLPRSQHADLIKRISEEVNNQDEELLEYVGVTKERFQNFQVDYFTSSKETMHVVSQEKNDRLVFKMNYMYDLDESIEPIVYLKKILEYCKEQEINVFCYIPPANYEYAEQLLGEKFRDKYDANVEILKEIIDKYEVPVLDMSYVLKAEQFADIHTIDETANYDGRKVQALLFMQQMGEMK